MIRKAESSDYLAMDEVFRAAARAFCARSYESDVIESWAGDPWPERFAKGKEDGDEQYVSTIAGEVVCFGCINLERHTLVSLFVSPTQSGNGIGQGMLEFLLARAAAAGISVIKLDSSLNAVSFYERHGFIEVGRSMYRTRNGVELDSVQMERTLSPAARHLRGR